MDKLFKFAKFLVPGERSTKRAVALHDLRKGFRSAINVKRYRVKGDKVAFVGVPLSGSIVRHVGIDLANGTLASVIIFTLKPYQR